MDKAPTPAKLTLLEEGDLIRNAYKNGKRNKDGHKTVMLPHPQLTVQRFIITPLDKTRKVTLGPPLKRDEQTTTTVSDRWLVARPADGSALPTYCVARDYGNTGVHGKKK
jgi:hypothetical protein